MTQIISLHLIELFPYPNLFFDPSERVQDKMEEPARPVPPKEKRREERQEIPLPVGVHGDVSVPG